MTSETELYGNEIACKLLLIEGNLQEQDRIPGSESPNLIICNGHAVSSEVK